MDELNHIFHASEDLRAWHVICRTLIIVVCAFLFIRLSGRRSFGLHAPFDNLLAILMGAISGQGIVGRASVLNVLVACFTVALAHRFIAIVEIYFPKIRFIFKGEKIELFSDGKIIEKNMVRSLVDEDDIMREFRLHACNDKIDDIEKIYMETSGQISTVLKKRSK